MTGLLRNVRDNGARNRLSRAIRGASTFATIFSIVAMTSACVAPRSISVASNATGEPTRITGLAKLNGFIEQAPPGATEDALLDEFELTAREASSTCVHFTMRTEQSVDLPPSEWTIELDGEPVQARDTAVQAVGYDYQGTRTVLAAYGTFLGDWHELQLREKETRTSYVAERTGTVCGPTSGGDALTLLVKWNKVGAGIVYHSMQWSLR